ncbi:ABC transporter ATP-binding protein [Bacillus bombysepticus]|nr:ABC transporter ATP-binding protein [Bacillus thuringiensis]
MKQLKEFLRIVYPYSEGNRVRIIICSLLMLLIMIINTIQPLFFGALIDNMSKSYWNNTFIVIIWIGIIGLVSIILTFIQGIIQVKIATSVESELKKKIISSVLHLDFKTYSKSNQGMFINILENDVRSFSLLFTQKISLFINVISIPIVALIMIRISLTLTIISIASFPINSIIFKVFGKKIHQKESLIKNKIDYYLAFTQEIFKGFKTIKIYNVTNRFLSYYKKTVTDVYKASESKGYINTSGIILAQIMNLIGYLVMVLTGVYQIRKGVITIGNLVSFNSYSSNLSTSLNNLSKINAELQEIIVSINRIENVLRVKDSELKDDGSIALDRINNLSLINVEYRYDSSPNNALENINLTISSPGIYFIMGSSGGGKSTLLNLITGVYSDYKGDIFFNNVNQKNIPNEILRKKIAYITQESTVFSMSIKENLLLYNDSEESNLIEVCKTVNLLEFIESLPNKFETRLGFDGISLSEGQKQRICIARALLRNADVYICDEVTSSLDSINTQNVMRIFNEIAKTKLVFMVTHNQSIVGHNVLEVKNNQILKRYGKAHARTSLQKG